ncbi:P44/Msp2 family outer membrane protein [Candidatus Wolbachia massiliensis]|uniref:P44/Msp2 family outer membrane protein n=1 Tax=Candidatus Wolbachia massiliensis TaxID=1845000 RepID=A0A7L7YQA2_9RICK|nr:P44/Msp2 family outer membrane protein [Candidatus Wolbachia massiliensis]QOD38199.1 P44/Msp2 family outer membrane protein [Candidatus Wolbachia massiliensis]
MSNKKTLAVTAFALLLSQQSFASETEGFYFGGRYHSQLLNSIGSLNVKQTSEAEKSGKAEHFTINETYIADKITGQKPSEYKGDYDLPFSLGAVAGYEGELGDNSYRFELEGVHSSIKADNVGLEGNQMSVSYLKKFEEGDEKGKTYMYVAKVDNDQIANTALMASAYYHLKNDNYSFFVGGGPGVARTNMFGKVSIRPAYQLKAGIGYHINENLNMHIGYRHFGAVGSDIKLTAERLGETVSVKDDSEKKKLIPSSGEKVDEEINVGNTSVFTHGIEVGFTFHPASKV